MRVFKGASKEEEDGQPKDKKKASKRRVAEPEDAAAAARGLRMVSSRWATGHCPACGGGFSRGDRIARPARAATRGGWKHLACALRR